MIDTTLTKIKGFIPKTITTNQAKDTGMAAVLICLLIGSFGGNKLFYGLAIVLILIDMTWPNIFKPAAKLWLSLSNILGSVTSQIVMSIIFLVLVLPIGFIRRSIGKDSLQLRKWKKNHVSVFKTREHEFTSEDIRHPY